MKGLIMNYENLKGFGPTIITHLKVFPIIVESGI